MIHTYRGKQGGYAVMTALLFFVASTAAVVASLSDGALREVRIVRNESFSKQSYYASESAAEDAVYRIKNSLPLGPTEILTLASSSASVSITDNPDGTKTVRSDGDAGGTKRTTELALEVNDTMSFPYALQAGTGGIDMDGSSQIEGDIYTTGSIRGCSSCRVTGMAVAAGVSSNILSEDNSTPIPPVSSVVFGNANGTQDFAQSFTVSDAISLMSIELYVRKVGNPANATIRITTDNAGKPSTTVLASGTLSSSLVSTSYDWEAISLTANPVLSTGTTYWIVVDANTNASSYYTIAANSAYVNGGAKVGRHNTQTWNATVPSNLDGYIKVYIGTNEDGVTGESEWNRLSVGSAYAHDVSFVNATGVIYCQTGVSNNKSCDTSRADPVIESNPVSESDIDSWETEASVSTHSGNYSIGGSSTGTLGPKKITGNMTVGDSATLNIAGTIWVQGNLSVGGSARIHPSNSTENYIILVNGTVSLGGSAQIFGSASSHIVIVSTSIADPAITISGSADDTVVSAPNGGLLVEGSGKVNVAAAKHISLTGSAQIEYDPSALDIDLTGGSGGGTFDVHSWKEVE
jgi:Flp pilus assembly protein TadG